MAREYHESWSPNAAFLLKAGFLILLPEDDKMHDA